jgi:hypothetical protein
MFTPAVFAALLPAPEPPLPEPVVIIWRRVNGCWHFFCRAPISDAERIVLHDLCEMGLGHEDYEVKQG